MPERRPRFSRCSDPAGLVLTERDQAIILACWEHQWLTRQQIQQLTGMQTVTRINARLRRLYDHAYLQRLRAGTVGAGLQPVYLAGEAAVPILGAHTGQSAGEIRERLREDAQASAVLLPHDLEVNDVRISLVAGLAARPECTLDLWLNTRESYDAYARGRVLRPDGYFVFRQNAVVHACFLEVDRGTTSLTRWQAKVRRYLDYRASGSYQARCGLTRFRVLVTVPSVGRLETLLAATQAITDRSFWFGLTREVIAGGDPARLLWHPVGRPGPLPLIETQGGW